MALRCTLSRMVNRAVATAIQQYLQEHHAEMVQFLAALVEAESPTLVPESQTAVQEMLRQPLIELGFDVTLIPGRQTGGHLLATAVNHVQASPQQLILGHTDTVWPIGTLKKMPLQIEENIMRGPGAYDMKAGLTQMIFALRALHALDLTPTVAPICFINSDEEMGSPESTPHIERLAQQVVRSYVLEPALEPDGRLKTARKGVAHYTITVHGRAAHAGLDPEKGASAILEMSYIIQKLFALNDIEQGITVNAGIIQGGLRANVVAPDCTIWVDARLPTQTAVDYVDMTIQQLQPELSGTQIEIVGGLERPPMERTPRNQRLWQQAQQAVRHLGLEIEQGSTGGASDGNNSSRFTATLDGLGGMGAGAHAQHEFVYLDKMVERTAVLALLLLLPAS